MAAGCCPKKVLAWLSGGCVAVAPRFRLVHYTLIIVGAILLYQSSWSFSHQMHAEDPGGTKSLTSKFVNGLLYSLYWIYPYNGPAAAQVDWPCHSDAVQQAPSATPANCNTNTVYQERSAETFLGPRFLDQVKATLGKRKCSIPTGTSNRQGR